MAFPINPNPFTTVSRGQALIARAFANNTQGALGGNGNPADAQEMLSKGIQLTALGYAGQSTLTEVQIANLKAKAKTNRLIAAAV